MPSSSSPDPEGPPATKPRAGSKALIREINEALVLDVVRAQRPVARANIATTTGLSPATVTGITSKLLRAGLLIETDVVRGTGGRPPACSTWAVTRWSPPVCGCRTRTRSY